MVVMAFGAQTRKESAALATETRSRERLLRKTFGTSALCA
jgi:hypothetical protein